MHKCPANNDQFTTYVGKWTMRHCYGYTYLSDRAKLVSYVGK